MESTRRAARTICSGHWTTADAGRGRGSDVDAHCSACHTATLDGVPEAADVGCGAHSAVGWSTEGNKTPCMFLAHGSNQQATMPRPRLVVVFGCTWPTKCDPTPHLAYVRGVPSPRTASLLAKCCEKSNHINKCTQAHASPADRTRDSACALANKHISGS